MLINENMNHYEDIVFSNGCVNMLKLIWEEEIKRGKIMHP